MPFYTSISKFRHAAVQTLTDASATPSVQGYSFWNSGTTGVTITDLLNGIAGQEVTIVSKGAITFDVTGTNLSGATSDIVTASGDITKWLCTDGTNWILLSYVDIDKDLIVK
jgi:hypothetical protein